MNKKWMTAAAILTLGSSLAFALPQDAGNGPANGEGFHRHGRHHRNGAKFAEMLGLTDAQKEQMKAIRQQTREDNKVFFEQARATRKEYWQAKKAGDTAKVASLQATVDAQKAQMKSIREGARAKMDAILTADQKAKLDAFRAAHPRGQHKR